MPSTPYTALNVKSQVVHIVTTYSSFTVTRSIAADSLASTHKQQHTATCNQQRYIDNARIFRVQLLRNLPVILLTGSKT
jgi:hypothetical protein